MGWAPEIEFSDRARVHAAGLRDCVPLRCFANVLVTDETNPLEPAEALQNRADVDAVGQRVVAGELELVQERHVEVPLVAEPPAAGDAAALVEVAGLKSLTKTAASSRS